MWKHRCFLPDGSQKFPFELIFTICIDENWQELTRIDKNWQESQKKHPQKILISPKKVIVVTRVEGRPRATRAMAMRPPGAVRPGRLPVAVEAAGPLPLPVGRGRRVGSRGGGAGRPCAGRPGRTGRRRRACSRCACVSGWSDSMIGWTLCRKRRTCEASPLEKWPHNVAVFIYIIMTCFLNIIIIIQSFDFSIFQFFIFDILVIFDSLLITDVNELILMY